MLSELAVGRERDLEENPTNSLTLAQAVACHACVRPCSVYCGEVTVLYLMFSTDQLQAFIHAVTLRESFFRAQDSAG